MTTDERIEAIRKLAARHPDPTTWLTGDINFLLAELDAAKAREAQLREALTQLIEPMSSLQRGFGGETMLVVSGADAMDRYRAARAALGEDTRG